MKTLWFSRREPLPTIQMCPWREITRKNFRSQGERLTRKFLAEGRITV